MFKKFAIELLQEISAECDGNPSKDSDKAKKLASIKRQISTLIDELKDERESIKDD